MENIYKSSKIIKRYEKPILTKEDIPYPSSLTFNAGITKIKDKYIMLFRNDYGVNQQEFEAGGHFEGTNIGYAESLDGLHFTVADKPCFAVKTDEIERVYDPRISCIDNEYYICCAMDTKHGILGAIYKTEDFKSFDFISKTAPDNRNMVLFPEKINGKYYRLERPMPIYSRGRDRFDIWISSSPDMKFWGESELVLAVEDVPFSNDKIGPAAPPIKTDKGWLCTFHAVDIDEARGKNGWEKFWKKRYTIGIMLLDYENPSRVIGMSKLPLMVAEGNELSGGFRNNVLFPCALIAEGDNVKMYYGVNDTYIALAEFSIKSALELCCDQRK